MSRVFAALGAAAALATSGVEAVQADVLIPGLPIGKITFAGKDFPLFPFSSDGNAKDDRLFGKSEMLGQIIYQDRTESVVLSGTMYTENVLTTLQDNTVITGFSFRLDSEETADEPVNEINFTEFNVKLSASAKNVGSMSTTFDQNYGAVTTEVLSGPLTISPGYFEWSEDMSGFNAGKWCPFFHFDQPFGYLGGNLLVELYHTGSGAVDGSDIPMLDFHGAGGPGNEYYRVMEGDPTMPGVGKFATQNSYQGLLIRFETCTSSITCPDDEITCYPTAKDCLDGTNGGSIQTSTPPNTVAQLANACVADGNGYWYAKCDGQCTYIWNCEPVTQVNGDPHLVGFNGVKFDFGGEGGSVFNIISDFDFQFNSLFEEMVVNGHNGTWMAEIGISTPNNKIRYDPKNGVLVNDNIVVQPGQSRSFDDVTVTATENSATITTSRYSVSAVAVSSKRYLNVDVSILRAPMDPHGVLGQTARFVIDEDAPKLTAEEPIEGEEMDYRVNDGLFGIDFAYNRFNKVKTTRSVIAARSTEAYKTLLASAVYDI